MPANRDPSQKFRFVFHKAEIEKSESPSEIQPQAVRILKKSATERSEGAPEVQPYQPIYFLKPAAESLAVESLKKNLQSLTELHQRFKFLLREIEEVDAVLESAGNPDSEES